MLSVSVHVQKELICWKVLYLEGLVFRIIITQILLLENFKDAMKTVRNVLAAQKTNVRLVALDSIFITVPVMMLAQHHTTLMITHGHVEYVMLAVRNVQISYLLVALRVNKTSISNLHLITQRVL